MLKHDHFQKKNKYQQWSFATKYNHERSILNALSFNNL